MNETSIGSGSGGKAAIERILKAYSFNSRQALCDRFGISKSTMSNRYMRDSFPADWVIQCCLETGALLMWLSTGQGNMYPPDTQIGNVNAMDLNLKSGAKDAVDRMLTAYGFTSRLQLCAQLNITKSSLANRVFRDSFPADWIIQCCLETGASLLWLSTGQGDLCKDIRHEVKSIEDLIAPQIEFFRVVDGAMSSDGYIVIDQRLLAGARSPALITVDNGHYHLIDREFEDVKNGTWLIDVEGIICLKKIIRIPVSKVRVSDYDGSFDCDMNEIKFIGKVKLTMTEN